MTMQNYIQLSYNLKILIKRQEKNLGDQQIFLSSVGNNNSLTFNLVGNNTSNVSVLLAISKGNTSVFCGAEA